MPCERKNHPRNSPAAPSFGVGFSGIIAAAILLLLTSATASAATWTALTHPTFIEQWPGSDLLWGTLDDTPAPGRNAFGGASAFFDSLGSFGYAQSMVETNAAGDAHTAMTVSGEWTNPGFAVFDSPFSNTLDPTVPSVIVVSPDRTGTLSYGVDQVDITGNGKVTHSGSFVWLLPNEDPAAIFAGQPDLVAHLELVLPLLPAGWTVMTTGITNFEWTAGAGAGITGSFGYTHYSFDAAPIPLPATAALALLPLTMLFARRRDSAARPTEAKIAG